VGWGRSGWLRSRSRGQSTLSTWTWRGLSATEDGPDCPWSYLLSHDGLTVLEEFGEGQEVSGEPSEAEDIEWWEGVEGLDVPGAVVLDH
jgi:hypothetical protein